MADVFISYASEDRAKVVPLVNLIEASGLSVWWDRKLESGSEWDEVIQRELSQASKVVVVWTKNSVQSNWVRTEAMEGLERDILFPVLLDKVTIPLAFKRIHAADLTGSLDSSEDPQMRDFLASLTGNPVDPIQSRKKGRFLSSILTPIAVAALALLTITVGYDRLAPGPQDPARTDGPTRVAVLPFRNLSPGQDLDWVAEGIAEALRSQIGTWGEYVVFPGAMTYTRRIDELPEGTHFALDGSIQLEGSEVTVRLDVIDMRANSLLWSQAITAAFGNPFELQRRISTRVAREFGESVGLTTPKPKPEAFTEFLSYLSLRSYGEAAQHAASLRRILNIDPEWGYGWADLAWVLMRASSLDYRPDLLDEGEAALARAKELAPEEPEIWFWADSFNKMFFRADLQEGERQAAIMLEGGYQPGYIMMMLQAGLHTEVEGFLSDYTASNPFDASGWELLSATHALNGNDADANRAALRVSNLFPDDALLAQSFPVLYPDYSGGTDRAEAYLEKMHAYIAQLEPSALNFVGAHRWLSMVEFKLALHLNDEQRALAAANRAATYGAIDAAAMMYLRLGDPRADSLLRRATLGPSFNRFNHYHVMPLLTPELREHPLVKSYRDAMGFTDQWRLELCMRVAALPPNLGITCDPVRYQTVVGN